MPTEVEEARQVLEEIHGSNPLQGRGRRRKDKGVAWTAARRQEKEEYLRELGRIKPVVIVNFNPFPLKVNGGSLFKDSVRACEIGKPYEMSVMREARWTWSDKGAGMDNVEQFDPIPYVPAQLAPEYIREYNQERQVGGVLIFMGVSIPDDLDVMVEVPVHRADGEGGKYNAMEKRNLKKMWDATIGAQNAHMLSKIEQANRDYEDPNKKISINYYEIGQYARLALHRGLIEKDAEKKAPSPDPCPICGATPNRGAAVCIACGQHVFDVVQAYERGAIEYGHFAVLNATDKDLTQINKIKEKRDAMYKKRGFESTE
jgi:hypothetical protein